MDGDFSEALGRTTRVSDVLSPAPARALMATLDRDPATVRTGVPLPPLFHWLYGHELVPRHRLGEDGHALKGDFLPALSLPRRMWAGGQLEFRGDLRIGETVERVSTITGVEPKVGRSGPLVLVTVEHHVVGDRGEVVESQDLVFLERPDELQTLPVLPPEDVEGDWEESLTPDVPLLFRFSALTFNAHRIHYDRDYARNVEFYPDLVVHGPLTAMLLADFAVRHGAGRLTRFSFRARRPMFVDRVITLQGRRDTTGTVLRALDHTGSRAMSAQAVFAP